MSNTSATAKIEGSGGVTVLSATGGTLCRISASYGKAISVNVNGNMVSFQTDQGYTVIYEINGYTPILKSARK